MKNTSEKSSVKNTVKKQKKIKKKAPKTKSNFLVTTYHMIEVI
jgi:hypothetical protein